MITLRGDADDSAPRRFGWRDETRNLIDDLLTHS